MPAWKETTSGRYADNVFYQAPLENPVAFPAQIAVVGLGYVGCVSAACLPQLGHDVIGVDRDEYKVLAVNQGKAPFCEPGLPEMLAAARASGKLRATTNMAEALLGADVVFLCVGTPSEPNGNMSVEQLRRVSLKIAPLLDGRDKPLIVAVRSTAYPGTCEDVVLESLRRHPMVKVVANPEFLREGSAVRDSMEPALLVVGSEDEAAARRVAGLYAGLPVEPCLTSLRAAELIKYACNAFHAVKISFANEIGAIAGALGIDGEEVMATLVKDTKLNASAAYLRSGFAFGGSCLPKDLRALTYRARRLELQLPMLESVLSSNEAHLARAIRRTLCLPGERIGVYGLAFKEDTDDLRESPVIPLLEQLLAAGRVWRVYDAHVRLDAIFGTNLNFLLTALPRIGQQMAASVAELVAWADEIVLTQEPTPEDEALIQACGKPVLRLHGGACPRGTRRAGR